jgi:tetratricopeptide (TPR) repeat protein
MALFRAERYAEAAEILAQATALGPTEDGCIHLSLALGQLQQLEASQEILEEAIVHFPNSAEVRAYLGTTLRSLGHLDAGILRYEEALQLDPDHVGALWGLGLALGMAGHPEEGLAPLWRAVGLAPNFAAPHFHLGILCLAIGDLEESHRQWRILQILSPRYAERLGQTLASQSLP